MKRFNIKLMMLTVLMSMVGTEMKAVTVQIDNIDYELNESTLTAYVSWYWGGYTSVTILPTVSYEGQNYTVTAIGASVFGGSRSLTSVIIPNTVTNISSNAFGNCSGLTSIDIPNSVKNISQNAFYGCTGLTSITIPESVKAIDYGAFAYCSNLTSVTFDNSTPTLRRLASLGGVFESCSKLKDIYYPAYAYEFFTTNAETKTKTLHPQIKIDNGWATYCATASFKVPDGIDAYVVESYNDGMVTLQKVTTINAGQGVLLKPASVGTFYNATKCFSTPDSYESNMLKGVTSVTEITATDGEYTNFVFSIVGDEIDLYPANAETLPAYKAYLQIPTASLPSGAPEHLGIVCEGEEITNIEKAQANTETDGNWYTLDGILIPKPSKKGVYIYKGKKVVIK